MFLNFLAEAKKCETSEILLANGESRGKRGQAIKGAGRMPWHWEPMKDVISCDKPRGDANNL